MAHLIAVFSPLASFLIVGIFGPRLGMRFSQILACTLMALSAFFSLTLFADIALGDEVIHTSLFPWIQVGHLKASWGFYIDTVSVVMMVVVTCVSLLVHIYSVGYMDHDRTPAKFMAFLSLFTFMMLMLVTAENLLQLFFGWEGVGLASYLLIGYWYERPSACAASMKAFIVNRIGDLGLVLAIGGLFLLFKTLDISTILLKVNELVGVTFQLSSLSFPVFEILAMLLFMGAMGKSAQLGLHTWLPDAMEGPTPVSALIHAATMVTAGVFLLARFSVLFELAPIMKQVITYVGAATALFAGTVALTQTDIKRVIAYSTCSQLGYMFFAEGLGAYHLALFHLTTHAFFKALLFLGAGSVIHALSDEQDMRHMGGIWRKIPVTYAMMWIGSLALAGVPFFAGYYSKDAILETALHSPLFSGSVAYVLGIGAAFLTALYSWRLLYLTFHGSCRAHERVISHIHEPGPTMLIPLIILALGAVFAGLFGAPYFNSASFWAGSLPPQHLHLHNLENEGFLHHLPTLAGAIGIGVATLFYLKKTHWPDILATKFKKIYAFFLNKWYFDELYNQLFVQPCLRLGAFFWQKGDSHAIDNNVINATARWAGRLSKRLSQMHTGLLSHYALWMLIGIGALLLIILVREKI